MKLILRVDGHMTYEAFVVMHVEVISPKYIFLKVEV
jgi:hypothetical protein